MNIYKTFVGVCADLLKGYQKVLDKNDIILPSKLNNMIENELGMLAIYVCSVLLPKKEKSDDEEKNSEEEKIKNYASDIFVGNQLAKYRAFSGIGDAKFTEGCIRFARDFAIKKVIRRVQLRYYETEDDIEFYFPLNSLYLTNEERKLVEKYISLRRTTVTNPRTINHMLTTFNALDENLRNTIFVGRPYFASLIDALNAAKERKSKRVNKFRDLRDAVVNNGLTEEQIQKLIEYFGTQDSSGTMEQGMGKK